MNTITILFPAYNERESINRNLEQIYANFRKININPEVLIVDDSTDGSERLFFQAQKEYKTLRVIHRTTERGVGSAIRRGIKEARGKYVIVSMFDSPQEIVYFPSIIKKLDEGYDLVMTSRFIQGAKMIRYPLKKRIANFCGNNLIKLLFLRFDLTDFTSLFKGFRRDKMMNLSLQSNEFSLGVEIATKSILHHYHITEVPADWIERNIGQSKLIIRKQIPHYLKTVFRVRLSSLFRHN